MKARSRRQIEMGRRALEFSQLHPDASPGYEVILGRLGDTLARADILIDQQRNGLLDVRIASRQKLALRRLMRAGHLAHLVRVARLAEREVPGLSRRFVLSVGGDSYVAFRTTARLMVAEVTGRKELFTRHGLSITLLDALLESLAQFDSATLQAIEGRRAHIGATSSLLSAGAEIVRIVRVLDALNKVRFVANAELRAAWESTSSVLAAPHFDPAESEVKPAA